MKFVAMRGLLAAMLAASISAQSPAFDADQVRRDANAALNAGDHAAAAAGFRRLVDADANDGQSWQLLGYSLHLLGKLDEALPLHRRAAEFPRFAGIALYNAACVHALQGRPDDAFTCLDRSIAAGYADVATLDGDTDLASLRGDARWPKVVAAMKAKGGDAPVQVFQQTLTRKQSRASWWGKGSSAGQIVLDWSPVPWQPAYDERLRDKKLDGVKWRLGADFWTRLDTSLEMRCGEVTVPPGEHYLTLERRGEQFVLALHEAALVRGKRLDAFFASQLGQGREVVLRHAAQAPPTRELQLAVQMHDGSRTDGELRIAFGPHALSVPIVVTLPSPQ